MRYRFFSLLAAAIIAFGIGGCGGGTSADPLGTDGITLESAASQVASNGTVVLTATVKNASGVAVVGRDVTFGFVANASAATLNTSEASSDSTGVATVIYRAGGASGVDIVRASINNGAYRDVVITVGTGGTGGIKVTVTPNLSSLSAGVQTIITADVLNADGTPAAGQTVTFTTAPSNSGATDPTPGSSATNADGKAFATYTAGNLLPGSTVYDVVSASVAGAASGVIITRTAAAGMGGVTMTVTPSLTSLGAGSQSIITAEVLNADGTPAAGQTVTFTTAPSNSGATDPTPGSSATNADGKAFATYTAGNNSPGSTVYDVVSASVTGAASGVIITRTAAAVGTGNQLAFTAAPTTLPATGGNSILTATVTSVNGSPVTNEPVTFSILTGPGTIKDSSGASGATLAVNTDTNGNAWVVFTGGVSPGDTAIQAQIAGRIKALIISW